MVFSGVVNWTITIFQIKTGVLVCGNMQDLMLIKLLTLLKMERGGVQLVLLFMPDSSLREFFFLES